MNENEKQNHKSDEIAQNEKRKLEIKTSCLDFLLHKCVFQIV